MLRGAGLAVQDHLLPSYGLAPAWMRPQSLEKGPMSMHHFDGLPARLVGFEPAEKEVVV